MTSIRSNKNYPNLSICSRLTSNKTPLTPHQKPGTFRSTRYPKNLASSSVPVSLNLPASIKKTQTLPPIDRLRPTKNILMNVLVRT